MLFERSLLLSGRIRTRNCVGQQQPSQLFSSLIHDSLKKSRFYALTQTSTTTVEGAASSPISSRDAPAIASEKLQIERPLFPWRHEGLDNLLPRFTPGTPEYKTLVPVMAPEGLMAKLFMGESVWNTLITSQWKRDLEEGMTFAFLQGVAGIVSNVYQVPVADIVHDSSLSHPMSFLYTPKKDTVKRNIDHQDPDCCPEIANLMAQPLRNLFEAAHESGTNQLSIQLQLTPKKTWFHRLYALPFLSRQQIQAQPDLMTRVFVNEHGRFQADFDPVYTFIKENSLNQLVNNGRMQTTLAAEALILCDELFCVRDAETGRVLQGNPDSIKEVAHLVTMERTCESVETDDFPYFPKIDKLTNWIIVDIDDLMGPRKWFHVVLPSDQSAPEKKDKNYNHEGGNDQKSNP